MNERKCPTCGCSNYQNPHREGVSSWKYINKEGAHVTYWFPTAGLKEALEYVKATSPEKEKSKQG